MIESETFEFMTREPVFTCEFVTFDGSIKQSGPYEPPFTTVSITVQLLIDAPVTVLELIVELANTSELVTVEESTTESVKFEPLKVGEPLATELSSMELSRPGNIEDWLFE